MSKLNVVRRCYNCGAILQDSDPAAEGYIEPDVLNQKNAVVLFCDHCYQQQKYNFSAHELTCSKEYLTMMEDAAATDALIVFVVDIFSFETSFVTDMIAKIRNNPILIVGNKRDLLPANADDDVLKEYVAHRFRAAGFQITHDDVLLDSIGALSPVEAIATAIEKKRRRHDVYLVGASGSGKTMLLSSLLRGYKNKTLQSVITAPYPGTNIPVLQIPLDSSSFIYDTPGTSIENSILSRLPADVGKCCIPNETVKARSYSLLAGDCLFVGGLARLGLKNGNRTEITFFGSSGVKLTRVRNKNPEELFFKMMEKGDLSPVCNSLNSANAFDAFDIEIEEEGYRDIGVQGLGWFRFVGAKQTFRIFLPKGVSLYASRSKILPENRK